MKGWRKNFIAEEGGKVGFSADAFTPFFEMINSEPGPVTSEGFKSIGLGELYEFSGPSRQRQSTDIDPGP